MPTFSDAYGSMTVLGVEPALTKAEAQEFHLAAEVQIHGGGRWFVLDMARVGGFDSQGLEELLWFQEQVDAAGGVVKVAGLKGHCRMIFEMVRFDKKFQVFENVHEAVKSFQ
ncbi:MAG: STAS domain-containing protein [Planctomycetota bacterium]|nr:STAS domain-containing protein [Planctomycetota bacterium]